MKWPTGPINSIFSPVFRLFKYVLPLPSGRSLMQRWNLPGSGLLEIEYERIIRGSPSGWWIFIVTNWPALYVKSGFSV